MEDQANVGENWNNAYETATLSEYKGEDQTAMVEMMQMMNSRRGEDLPVLL